MDGTGMLVVPKEICEQARLAPGMPVDIRVRDGRIEIEPAARGVRVESRGRLRVAAPVEPSDELTADSVRATRDQIRRDR